jgi:dihydropteroate synthase
MGIVNVTPDSFSGDGVAGRPEDALAQALRMEADGADVVDVGGQSTRPGHIEITIEEELDRVTGPLIEIIRRVRVPVSVDTYRYEVASAAVAAGARIVNDVWGLKRDPRLAELAAQSGASLILMHNQEGTEYQDLVPEVLESLSRSVASAEGSGVARARLMVDPGIGFGKTPEQNLVLLHRLDELRALGLPILLGTSRKSVIGKVLGTEVDDRLEGTAATVALGIAAGADMVRVHDVKAMVRVCRMTDAVIRQPVRA